MLQARLDLSTAGTPALAECLSYLDGQVRPVLQQQPGSLGLSVLASPERGVALLESFWASRAAQEAGERAAASLREELAGRAPLVTEEYRVSVFEHEAPLTGGEAARLTRISVQPSAADDVIEVFGDTAVPWLAESPGFRAALLFAGPASGRLISQTIWADAQARAAGPSTAAVIQADLLDAAGCVIRGPEDYSVVFSSARSS